MLVKQPHELISDEVLEVDFRNSIHKDALQKWYEAEGIGTAEVITGNGKTFIAMHALCMIPPNSTVLIAYERNNRDQSFMVEGQKYKEIFGTNPLEDLGHDITFECYQSYKRLEGNTYDLIIADEIHDSLTPQYGKLYIQTKFTHILGLSATIDTSTTYRTSDGYEFTKGDLINKVAPVIYSYMKFNRDIIIYKVKHEADAKYDVDIKGKKYNEESAIEYYKSKLKYYGMRRNSFMINKIMAEYSKILYDLRSKIGLAKKILKDVTKGQVIVFGNNISFIQKIVPYVVSYRSGKYQNQQLIERFRKGHIEQIGSFHKLKQGENLGYVDAIIITSYFSKSKDLIQRIGRGTRGGEFGPLKVIIFCTEGTREEGWFNKMMEGLEFADYQLVKCNGFMDLKQKYNELD